MFRINNLEWNFGFLSVLTFLNVGFKGTVFLTNSDFLIPTFFPPVGGNL